MSSELLPFQKSKLEEELANRSLAGSITFAALAFSIALMDLIHGEYKALFQAIAATIVVINLIRFIFAKRFLMKTLRQRKSIQAIQVMILINPLLWSALFLKIYDPTLFHTYNSLTAFLITAGLAVGSTYSLAPFFFGAVFFQISVLIPLNYFSISSWLHDSNKVSFVLPIASLVFLLYTIAQTRLNRKTLLESIQFELSLLKSNESLRQSQKQLQENSVKLMHASRLASLGEMAGGIAHEINNPLAIISGSLDILKRAIEKIPEDQSKLIERINKIQASATRIKNIVAGLFTFAGQSESIPLEPVHLQLVIKDALAFCEEKFRAKNILLQSMLEEDFVFYGRQNQVTQILLNLLNNSFDAVQEQETRWVKIHSYHSGPWVVIDVTDSGAGIPLDMKERLFQPFSTSKEVGRGTGLGLSIARGIAREHSGDVIYVDNEAHTTFRITLPRAESLDEEKNQRSHHVQH